MVLYNLLFLCSLLMLTLAQSISLSNSELDKIRAEEIVTQCENEVTKYSIDNSEKYRDFMEDCEKKMGYTDDELESKDISVSTGNMMCCAGVFCGPRLGFNQSIIAEAYEVKNETEYNCAKKVKVLDKTTKTMVEKIEEAEEEEEAKENGKSTEDDASSKTDAGNSGQQVSNSNQAKANSPDSESTGSGKTGNSAASGNGVSAGSGSVSGSNSGSNASGEQSSETKTAAVSSDGKKAENLAAGGASGAKGSQTKGTESSGNLPGPHGQTSSASNGTLSAKERHKRKKIKMKFNPKVSELLDKTIPKKIHITSYEDAEDVSEKLMGGPLIKMIENSNAPEFALQRKLSSEYKKLLEEAAKNHTNDSSIFPGLPYIPGLEMDERFRNLAAKAHNFEKELEEKKKHHDSNEPFVIYDENHNRIEVPPLPSDEQVPEPGTTVDPDELAAKIQEFVGADQGMPSEKDREPGKIANNRGSSKKDRKNELSGTEKLPAQGEAVMSGTGKFVCGRIACMQVLTVYLVILTIVQAS